MKNSHIYFLVIFLFLYSFSIRGQITRCGTPSPTQFIATDPLLYKVGNLNIPVVFHVVYSGTDNVTDTQLADQITALNNAYSSYQISFYLSGTTRTYSSTWQNITRGSQQETDMTDSLSIDPQYKLNIYITAISPLGYTINWPWDVSEYSKQNGVVIQPGTLPGGNLQDYNEGKTAVHEVGHYLGIFHTFQNECTSPGDMVDDTPYHQANSGCPSENTNTCPQTGYDPIHNFMNYTSDPCMNQFTTGQIQRARGIIYLYKPRLGNQFAPAKIDYFYQQPDPIYNGGTGYVYAVLEPGIDDVTYSWYASYSPTNMTFHFAPQGNMCQVDYYIPYNTLPTINFTCVASNAYGTDVKSYQLNCALYSYYSFANLAFETNGEIKEENPVLVSSLSNPGVDITDYYLINENIKPEDKAIKFLIHENEKVKGNTNLDQVELWEIKASINEEIAVTEDGEVLCYKKPEMPDQLFLNGKQDVTDILADRDDQKLTVKKGDKITMRQSEKSVYDSGDYYSVFCAQLKNEAAFEASDNKTEKYYFRPQPSIICKKINKIQPKDLSIEFTEDAIIDYLAIVKNEQTAKIDNLKMLEAVNREQVDLKGLLSSKNASYTKIYPGDKVRFAFESQKAADEKAFYILKTVGRFEQDDLSLNKNEKLASMEIVSEKAESEAMPLKTELLDNYPNPFNPVTQITYQLKENAFVELTVFNSLGQEVRKLFSGNKDAGYYSAQFDGSKLASGVYIYRLQVGAQVFLKKMLLTK